MDRTMTADELARLLGRPCDLARLADRWTRRAAELAGDDLRAQRAADEEPWSRSRRDNLHAVRLMRFLLETELGIIIAPAEQANGQSA